MTRRFNDAMQGERCEAVVTLRDGSTADCGRRRTISNLCTQHAKIAGAKRESAYAACIRVAPTWTPEYDVRHVEAYMRLEHSTLDGLVIWQFNSEVATAIQCIDMGGRADAEALARSYGL